MAGRRGRCAACRAEFTVTASAAPEPVDSPSIADLFDDDAGPPQYIAVECRLCQTRMYARPDQVGQKLKCPDCGTRNEVPPPPKRKAKNIPEAMEGEQYELWDADVQPAVVVAAQPKYIAVKCTHCDTLLYATEKQVGKSITCPDCGKAHQVVPPARPKPSRSVVARDADTPQLDPAAAPGERPPVMISAGSKMDFELREEADYARAVEESRRTGKPMKIDVRGRPIMPRWPLLTGVLPFMFSHGVPVRWLALSVGFYCSIWLLLTGVQLAFSGGMGAIAGMCLFAAGCVATMLCASLTAAFMLAIVGESSEGNNEVQGWPSFFDSFGDLFLFVVAGTVSFFPGWLVSQFVLDRLELHGLSIAVSVLVGFPVVLLSQLDIGSMWAVLSPKVLRSMVRCPISWLTFYVESAAILAACLAAAVTGMLSLYIPLSVAGVLLYARLLGRLGWRLAEALADEESGEA
jgi:DNA-directed RNA polymerase subunit M/transcription elongation factor TFIIS